MKNEAQPATIVIATLLSGGPNGCEVWHRAPNGAVLRGYRYLRWDGWYGCTDEVIAAFDAENPRRTEAT